MSAGVPRILSIAGTDPSGGAGIQADLKSIAATGGYGMAAVTALVAQNTRGVRSVHTPPARFLREQLDAVSDDVEIDAVKIGMLGSAEATQMVDDWLVSARVPAVVLDPVMIATSGDRLLDAGAEAALRQLLHRVDLVTPNLPELAVLVQETPADSWDQALAQGERLSAAYGVKVLVKGGHLTGDSCPDALVDAAAANPLVLQVRALRANTVNTHGTGCSMSAAMATFYALTGRWDHALTATKEWLQEALEHADELDVGAGHGPVHHFYGVWKRGLVPAGPHKPVEPAEAAPVVEAAGPHTAELWDLTAAARAEIDELDFVRNLGNGCLKRSAFDLYLGQDALYLRGYARALARASELAPAFEEQVFWAKAAHDALVTEMELHASWLPSAGVPGSEILPSPVTSGYLTHLLGTDKGSVTGADSRDSEYERLVGAVLPCFWIYADVGARLRKASHPGHPYADWLATYSDPAFTEATVDAVRILENVLERSTDDVRAVIFRAFRESTHREYEFFAAGTEES
ncbi:bifunctional hydroxymethylpyrimidine kinase/phosphomethylpyrimidine kinase [Arthrobacter sp. APC 3897]|uniref:bifunctional hydroxymethylpyrimidine kinase/phosphomethylpyrimidine kinase n=1 Tax=Arthrobacter sp. APC 3897 TaxID=3035204 RepID=UPI0025B28CBC|nr:bifunctional hydroxymethylpyrimidine kinase/phosphomethylpyrimidine kinase [Arthrobacter sp. APC 3897]MDN3482544.1 bifunctional hydroxymethylpyrimidine kinase/phosphomethylpyrimidine kinase [Arthrobacter sp. APC 3897]